MRKTLLTATALAALIVSPAFADDPVPATSAATTAATSPDTKATTPATAPATSAAAPNTAAAPATTAATTPAEPKFIGQQDPSQILTSNLVGSSVYDPSNQELGKVNDVILAPEGKVDAIVIGVGGFLGIGQKNVAVAFPTVKESTDDKGKVKLVLDSTKDELNKAPAYVTVAMLKQQQQLDQQDSLNAQPPASTSTN